jgi:pyruvate carboxylase
MKRALDEYRIIGIRTNIPFHQALLENPEFLSGDFDTQFIQDAELPASGNPMDPSLPSIAALSAVLATHKLTQRSGVSMQRGKRDVSNWKWIGRWERTKE